MAPTVPNRDDWFEEDHGFPRPNWDAISGWMRVYVPDEQLEDAWRQIARHWIGRLRDRLGGKYTVAETEYFVLLADSDEKKGAAMLSFLENARANIYRVIGDTRSPKTYGKHVVIRFSAADDYYTYVSQFHPDGEFAESSGMFLEGDYNHIAFPQSWEAEEGKILVHELTHNLLSHLPQPRWLNEALAMAFESEVGGQGTPLTRELARSHREYWNEKTIQEFWSGTSFFDIKGQELSYSLSRVLLNLIYSELQPSPKDFRKFVLRADWTDAGAVAVREHLDAELENLVAAFLGPGNWTPRRSEWKYPTPKANNGDDEVVFEEDEK